MNKMLIVLGVIGVVIIGGILLSQKTKAPSSQTENQQKVSSSPTTMEKKEDAMMKKQMEVMEMAMKDTTSKKGKLIDVSGGNTTGMAYVLRKDGKLFYTVSATLPDPTSGMFYEGWLVKKGSNPVQFVDTGKLTKQQDGSYEVSYSNESNTYEGYDFVVVTIEQVDDQKPEKHILEGDVK